jgi:hypothetical protein
MQNFVRIVRPGPAIAASLVLLLASAAHAQEIYKWVDKDGKTHYSSRKEDAAGAATTTMRPAPPPQAGSGAPPAARAANVDVIRRSAPSEAFAGPASAPAAVQQPVTREYPSEAGAGKCQLARGILAGNVTHPGGAPIDAYDRQVAESDVRTFCRK